MSTLAIASAVLLALAPTAAPTSAAPAPSTSTTAPAPAPTVTVTETVAPVPTVSGPTDYYQGPTDAFYARPMRYAIVVSGNNANLVDALTASPIAGVFAAPIFYTNVGGDLPIKTREQIAALKPNEIIIVGGTSVVSSGTEASVRNASRLQSVIRLAGEDRYATAATVATWLNNETYADVR